MTRAERIEAAILAARAVAATPEEDERRLRERGEIVTPGGVYKIKGDA